MMNMTAERAAPVSEISKRDGTTNKVRIMIRNAYKLISYSLLRYIPLTLFLVFYLTLNARSLAAAENVSAPLVERGAPKLVDFSKRVDSRQWNDYLTALESGKRKPDKNDFILFDKMMRVNEVVDPSYTELFTASALVFKGTDYQDAIGSRCRELLKNKKATDWSRLWAADSLSMFGDAEAVDSLLVLDKNSDPSIRKAARHALLRLGYSFPAMPKGSGTSQNMN
jgi:hypothetical protein